MNELMEKIQDLKTEFNKETEMSKRTQTEMKMQLKNSVTQMRYVNLSHLSPVTRPQTIVCPFCRVFWAGV